MIEGVLCRIKTKNAIKPQDVVEKSKKISLYSILGITDSGPELVRINFNYSKSSSITDTARV